MWPWRDLYRSYRKLMITIVMIRGGDRNREGESVAGTNCNGRIYEASY